MTVFKNLILKKKINKDLVKLSRSKFSKVSLKENLSNCLDS
jgi:hypothetical protein